MKKKVIIIGGGVAGLSAGIYGQLNGYDTEIMEMHSIPGGQCTAWKRRDYTFDYCLHWLVGSSHGPFHEVWRETGALDDSTRIWDPDVFTVMQLKDGSEFVLYADVDRWESYLLELAPEDRQGIVRMCNHMRKLARFELFDKPYYERGLRDNISFALKSGPAMRLFFRYGRMSLDTYFRRLNFKSPVLNNSLMELSAFMGEFSAFAFLMSLTWFSQKNAGYPIGGSRPFAGRMENRYRELGGSLSLNTRVEKILVDKGRVKGVILADGSTRPADVVIGACDLHALVYGMLEGKYPDPKIEKAFRDWPLFTPVIQVSFGIDVPVKTRWHTRQILVDNECLGHMKIRGGYAVSSYNHDDLITPEGKTVMKLVMDSPYADWEGMSDEDYLEEKEKIASDAKAKLEALYPEVKGHVEVVDVATPLTGIRYTGVYRGAYEGFQPTMRNMTKSLKYTVRGLEDFYLAGQWLQPGGGLPPSAISGKWVVKLMTKKDRKNFRVS